MLVLQCVGAGLLLLAWIGTSLRRWREIDDRYLTLNIVGAALLAFTAWTERQYGFAVLTTIWCLAAMRSAISLRQR